MKSYFIVKKRRGEDMSKTLHVTLNENLYFRLEEYVKQRGFMSKSEFIRFLLRREMMEEKERGG